MASGLIDAVDIVTSNDAHIPIALDAGLPVSIEKPSYAKIDTSIQTAIDDLLASLEE